MTVEISCLTCGGQGVIWRTQGIHLVSETCSTCLGMGCILQPTGDDEAVYGT